MKIAVLTPDLSHNCLGRAHVLAQVLARRHEVEILGPIVGEGIWEPCKGTTIKITPLPYTRLWLFDLVKTLRAIDAQVIIASKPLFFSYTFALIKRAISSVPVILDIDDWEMGFHLENLQKTHYHSAFYEARCKLSEYRRFVTAPQTTYLWTALNEKLVRFADALTVSNPFLQSKFGGTIVWHVRDTNWLDPLRYDKSESRLKYGVDTSAKVVLFLGTPRQHKGIEDLVDAIDPLDGISLILVGAGTDQYSKFLVRDTMRRLSPNRFFTMGAQPFEKLPQLLALSDVIAVPQRKGLGTIGQLPAKLFDAMAMAKPILTTNVGGIPEVIGECGWIVEPNSPSALREAISSIFEDRVEAAKRGESARKRCIANFSYEAADLVISAELKKVGCDI